MAAQQPGPASGGGWGEGGKGEGGRRGGQGQGRLCERLYVQQVSGKFHGGEGDKEGWNL